MVNSHVYALPFCQLIKRRYGGATAVWTLNRPSTGGAESWEPR